MDREIREVIKKTNGIVEHEFSDEIVKACAPDVDAMLERIATGQTTLEEEDERLMKNGGHYPPKKVLFNFPFSFLDYKLPFDFFGSSRAIPKGGDFLF